MMKIVSIILQVIAVSAGAFLGLWLKTGGAGNAAPHEEAAAHEEDAAAETKPKTAKSEKKKSEHNADKHRDSGHNGGDEAATGFIKFSRQFIVPVMKSDDVNALAVLDINLEVTPSEMQSIYAREPKVRDALLSVLLRLSNEGAFNDKLLADDNIAEIRAELLTAARAVLGDDVKDVLILNIARQDF